MNHKTALDRLGITHDQLVDMYNEAGSMRALAAKTGLSKATIVKHLRDVPKHKPWACQRMGKRSSNIDYLRARFRREAMTALESALVGRKIWTDINNREIPLAAIQQAFVEPPSRLIPIIPIYATLKDGQSVIFMFKPDIDWITDPAQEELTSTEETPRSFFPAPSGSEPQSYFEPESNPE